MSIIHILEAYFVFYWRSKHHGLLTDKLQKEFGHWLEAGLPFDTMSYEFWAGAHVVTYVATSWLNYKGNK